MQTTHLYLTLASPPFAPFLILSLGPTTNIRINIDGSPNLIAVIKTNAIRIALVPPCQHRTTHVLSHVAFHIVSHVEPQHAALLARQKSLPQLCRVQILTDENERARPAFARLPSHRAGIRGEEVSHSLEDEFFLFALDGDYPLVPVQRRIILVEQRLYPSLEHGHVHLAVDLCGYGGYRAVVSGYLRLPQKVRIERQYLVEVEGANVEEFGGGDVPLLGSQYRRGGVERAQSFFDHIELLLAPLLAAIIVVLHHQIDLVQNNLIGEAYLLLGLVLRTLGPVLVQPLEDVLRIGHRDDAIELVHPLEGFLAVVRFGEEGLDDGGGIGEAGRFDDDSVECFDLFVQALQGRD
mmetsp:Transcript_20505/g.49300  ORF Transcript_20505/g.49300 Transcript_20505/m.49300 type:complete len:351 (-) Transcript_20505:348-1400(-)